MYDDGFVLLPARIANDAVVVIYIITEFIRMNISNWV